LALDHSTGAGGASGHAQTSCTVSDIWRLKGQPFSLSSPILQSHLTLCMKPFEFREEPDLTKTNKTLSLHVNRSSCLQLRRSANLDLNSSSVSSCSYKRFRFCLIDRHFVRVTNFVCMYTVSQKSGQTYFFSELCQILTDCENFWHKDNKEDMLFLGILIFHIT